MKKYLITGVLAILLIMPIVGAADLSSEKNLVQPVNVISGEDFTHTVFAEYGTTTGCGYCPPASEALYSIYQSGDYPFYYVSLVADKNTIAAKRLGAYKAIAVPVVFFDGGDVNVVGDVGESVYRSNIEDMGEREVKQPLDMTTSVTWDGNAKITVSVTIKNNGNFFYLGILRSFVTEIESRWDDAQSNPYHFGFLDFAFNRPILLFPGGERTFTKEWDGAKDHGGQTFEDIAEDNIMVLSSVSHWIPQKRIGYDDKTYYAFIVDQSSGAVPS
jgi:glutaredoxin